MCRSDSTRRQPLRLLPLIAAGLVGCGYPALVIVLTQGGSGAGPQPVRVEGLELEPTTGAGRPADLGQVPVAFRLVGDQNSTVALTVRISTGGASSSPAILLGDPLAAGLAASPDGVPHRLLWDARANGISPLSLATLELTATRNDGQTASASTTATIGNLPPTVSSERLEGGTRDTIVVRFELDDASRDPASVRIDYKLDGEGDARYRPIEVLIGTLTGLPSAHQDVSVAWNSLAADDLAGISPGNEPAPDQIAPGGVGRTDQRVVLRLTASDGLPDGAASGVLLGPIAVDNNLAPRAQSFFDLAQDRVGPLAIAFTLTEDEGDPVEVLVQWRLASESDFPRLDDQASNPFVDPQSPRYVGASVEDPAVRAAMLQDAEVRRALHLVTEAPPTLRAMVGAGSTSSTIIAGSLSGQAPPELFQGATVRGGFATATWTASALGFAGGRLTLGAPLPAPPVAGAPLEVTLARTQGHTLRPPPAGAAYRAVWDARRDLLSDGEVFVRITPFDAQEGRAGESAEAVGLAGALPARATLSLDQGAYAYDAELSDLNGDGRVDLALSRGDCSDDLQTVDVYLQTLAGTLPGAPSATLTTVFFPAAIASGDLNGDGRADLLVTSFATSSAAVHLQSPGGVVSSTPSFLLAAAADVSDAAIGDLDGDRTDDIAIAGEATNEVLVYLQSPTGTLSRTPSLTLPQPGGPYELSIADLNRDGQRDLVVTRSGATGADPPSVAIYLGVTSGALPTSPDVTWDVDAGLGSFPPPLVRVGDFDGDTRQDLAVTQPDLSEVWFYLQGAGGALPAPPRTPTVWPAPVSIEFAAAGDLDGDGRSDLAVTEEFAASATVVFGGAGGIAAGSASASVAPAGTGLLLASDFNRDGRTDLAVANGELNLDRFSVLLQNPAGAVRLRPTLLASATSLELVASGDLDGDGRGDLLLGGGFFLPELLLHRQTVSGRIPDLPSETRSGAEKASVSIGDANGDGRADLVTTDFDAEVRVFLQAATGTLATVPSATFSLPADPATWTGLADLTGDGRADLIALSTDGNEARVDVFPQEADGALAATPVATLRAGASLPAGAEPDRAAVGDLDGDGRLDLVVVTPVPTSIPRVVVVSLFLQTASGTLSVVAARVYEMPDTSGTLSVSLATGDVDGDGRADLAVLEGDDTTSTLRIFLQAAGAGLGAVASQVLPGSVGGEVAMGDVSGDGRADLLVSDAPADALRIYVQSAQGALPPTPTAVLSTGTGPGVPVLADLNGDGLLDVAVGNLDDNTVTIFWQE